MTRRSEQTPITADEVPPLAIQPDKVCWVIVKAREFDVKDVAGDQDPASNASDDNMISVLEDRADDPVEQELRGFISTLDEDEQIDLVALAWLGRDDDSTLGDWESLRAEAARAHASHGRQTASYLLGEPMLGDFLEEGLARFGLSCEDFESNRV